VRAGRRGKGKEGQIKEERERKELPCLALIVFTLLYCNAIFSLFFILYTVLYCCIA